MNSVETSQPKSGIGRILVALILGLILGYFIKPGKGKDGGTAGAPTGGDPCGSSTSTAEQVNLNDLSQPCLEMSLDSTKSETVIWSAPNGFHPYVVFQNPAIPTPVVSGNTATSIFPAGPPNQPTAAYSVNIVPTGTKLPLPTNQATPTPGMYGRIIIKP